MNLRMHEITPKTDAERRGLSQFPMSRWPVLRADGESAHETSGIHQAEDIDEDRTLPEASIGSSSEAEVPANLRKPNPK